LDEAIHQLIARLDPAGRELFESLNKPADIQAFLDSTLYPSDTRANRSPLTVLRERTAHCLDGALFAAAALRKLGHPPRVIELFPEPGTDDDHVLALFTYRASYGAVAKSNFTGLRYREPVYRSLRELVMSYFEDFFNVDGMRTLRFYTRPLDLRAYDAAGWMWADEGADALEKRLFRQVRIPLIAPETAAGLTPLDPLSYRAGTLATNPAGLFKPEKHGSE
jgi:hypothetical protein